jgi:hypothetical protein
MASRAADGGPGARDDGPGGVAPPDGRDGEPRAGPARARPPRRRPAAAGRPTHPAWHRRGATQEGPKRRGRRRPAAGRRGGTDTGRAPSSRTRRLPAGAHRPGYGRSAAIDGATGAAPRSRERGRRHAAPDRDRGRHLLHLRRGGTERPQACDARHRDLDRASREAQRPPFRGPRRWSRLRLRPCRRTGLRNMHDRIEAVGGRLAVDSEPGRGTRVTGSVPLR